MEDQELRNRLRSIQDEQFRMMGYIRWICDQLWAMSGSDVDWYEKQMDNIEAQMDGNRCEDIETEGSQ